MRPVKVIGAGLAGCEAAWQLVKRGIPVDLYEMKPEKMTPAHKSKLFSELVCSNSLRSDRLTNAVGLLKEEMRRMDSLIMKAADLSRVPAGGALAVDREQFSGFITETIRSHPLVTVKEEEVIEIPESPCIIATGPLTSEKMCDAIRELPGMTTLNFYDAAAPIVTADSLDMTQVYRASRYGRGDDYLNCPMDREQYEAFWKALTEAETVPVHGFEETKVFEGCMPVESMAKRGPMVLAFGPLKPVGLPDPRTGKDPYAVVQLRQDDAANTLYNIVGFQTRLKFPEQKRVFGMIPGLENAEFARYGVMHRNTFLNSPGMLDEHYCMLKRDMTYFAGQMTGVEGYVESASSGLVCGVDLAMRLLGKPRPDFTRQTATGSLGYYVSCTNTRFQPMNVTFGIIQGPEVRVRSKMQKYEAIGERALKIIDEICEQTKMNRLEEEKK